MTKWKYGNSWEKFPIENGEVWGIKEYGSMVSVHNIYDALPRFMNSADLIFVDPPWNLGNLNGFYTKAGRNDYRESFSEFVDTLFLRLEEIDPCTCYIEIGKQAVNDFVNRMSEIYRVVQRWPVTYYKKHPTWIVRGSYCETKLNLSGMDEKDCIYLIAEQERYSCIGDLCMGQGLVGLAAHNAKKRFVGTELNKRRLAVLLDKLTKRGAIVERIS